MAALALFVDVASAASQSFSFKAAYHDVAKDPDGVWSGKDLAPPPKGAVTIYEYSLASSDAHFLVSQIWNADCASAACPTRLLEVGRSGERKLLVDDMMHQVIPPDDPTFAGIFKSEGQQSFAEHPFALSEDGRTLLNGDFKFKIDGGRR